MNGPYQNGKILNYKHNIKKDSSPQNPQSLEFWRSRQFRYYFLPMNYIRQPYHSLKGNEHLFMDEKLVTLRDMNILVSHFYLTLPVFFLLLGFMCSPVFHLLISPCVFKSVCLLHALFSHLCFHVCSPFICNYLHHRLCSSCHHDFNFVSFCSCLLLHAFFYNSSFRSQKITLCDVFLPDKCLAFGSVFDQTYSIHG